MHIHILGICGTFMGGVARLAIEAGHSVSGSDANVYPPMSTQLRELDVTIDALNDPEQFSRHIDIVVVGNAMTRGYPVVEQLLNSGLPYTSGPQWLAEHVLHGQHVLAVSGTHGKTTTSSMLAWILSDSGLNPGFLIGGVPDNFGVSAQSGEGRFFVVEADEYDSAFFDKRSKFVHYRPRTLVMNNLEFDHADIFDSLADIQRQFHHVVRTVPSEGRIIRNATDSALDHVMGMGCWSEVETFAVDAAADWSLTQGSLCYKPMRLDNVKAPMPGAHNASNALAAIAAANHVGISPARAVESLKQFAGIARRLQVRGVEHGITVYDDFAHHPTAVTATLAAVNDMKLELVTASRTIAVLEPRSNTMKTAVDVEALRQALSLADAVWLLAEGLTWNSEDALKGHPAAYGAASVPELLDSLTPRLKAGDQVVVMSNGSFGGIHQQLLQRLASLPSV